MRFSSSTHAYLQTTRDVEMNAYYVSYLGNRAYRNLDIIFILQLQSIYSLSYLCTYMKWNVPAIPCQRGKYQHKSLKICSHTPNCHKKVCLSESVVKTNRLKIDLHSNKKCQNWTLTITNNITWNLLIPKCQIYAVLLQLSILHWKSLVITVFMAVVGWW